MAIPNGVYGVVWERTVLVRLLPFSEVKKSYIIRELFFDSYVLSIYTVATNRRGGGKTCWIRATPHPLFPVHLSLSHDWFNCIMLLKTSYLSYFGRNSQYCRQHRYERVVILCPLLSASFLTFFAALPSIYAVSVVLGNHLHRLLPLDLSFE